jgi:hypothetical protein
MLLKPFMLPVFLALPLAACTEQPKAPPKEQSEDEKIAEYCNRTAAEIVANPDDYTAINNLYTKALEEEWDWEKVNKICGDKIERKMKLK